MKQEVAFTSRLNVDEAIKEVEQQLTKATYDYSAVIFFASSEYNFQELSKKVKEKFPRAEVIGTSTSGEISASGFTKKTLVLTALTCNKTRFSGVIVEDVDKFPIIHKSEIESAITRCGIQIGSSSSHKDAFAITFVNGLCNAEEALLSLFYAIIKNDQFTIAGGSAGDDLKFKQTYVSYNGNTTSNGAVVLFVKTQCAFDIYKENIFKPSGKRIAITKADTYTRRIYQIDGKNAKQYYADCLNLPESSIENAILDHPFGRVFGGNMFISSLASFNGDGSINMYSRVLQNSSVELLDPENPTEIAEETCSILKEKIKNPGCVLIINCILRTISFEQKNLCSKMTELYKRTFPTFCGFSSYGEQIGRINSNQTFVSVIIGE